jgi:hypothetical protein
LQTLAGPCRAVVRKGGLEPPRCYPQVPETCASTSSATFAGTGKISRRTPRKQAGARTRPRSHVARRHRSRSLRSETPCKRSPLARLGSRKARSWRRIPRYHGPAAGAHLYDRLVPIVFLGGGIPAGISNAPARTWTSPRPSPAPRACRFRQPVMARIEKNQKSPVVRVDGRQARRFRRGANPVRCRPSAARWPFPCTLDPRTRSSP